MSVQELNNEQRILFLIEFVEDLILQATKEIQVKEIIAAEKIKRKFLQENQESIDFKIVPFFQEYNPSQEKSVEVFGRLTSQLENENKNRNVIAFKKMQRPSLRQPPSQVPLRQQTSEKISQELKTLLNSQSTNLPMQNFGNPLQKIEALVLDQNVQSIECPGTGKNILVKVRNKINVTRIILSENEIKEIIDYFAQKAHVPILGGILKAAVDDMLISAVVSNYAGSRFILTKKSPYALLENIQ